MTATFFLFKLMTTLPHFSFFKVKIKIVITIFPFFLTESSPDLTPAALMSP